MQARLALGALVVATVLVVGFYHFNSFNTIALGQEKLKEIFTNPDDQFQQEYDHSKMLQARDSVEGAEKVNARFGGAFHNGVGSNTWKGTPWGKYDEAVAARKQMLMQLPSENNVWSVPSAAKRLTTLTVSNPDLPSEQVPNTLEEEHIEAPKDADYSINPRESIETLPQRAARQKQEIAACIKACTMPLCVEACHAISNPSKLNEVVNMPAVPTVPLQQQRESAGPASGTWRHFVEKCQDACKDDHCRELCSAVGSHKREQQAAEISVEEDDAPKVEMPSVEDPPPSNLHPILPPPLPKPVHLASEDLPPPPKEQKHNREPIIAQAATEELAEEPLGAARKVPWFDQDSFHASHPSDGVSVAQKEFFWQGLGDEKNMATSRGRSTRPISAARAAPSALEAPTQMLLQENAEPYYLGAQAGEQDGGNPFAKGWNDVKGTNLDQVDQAINQQLEPLAQEYPYIRAIRH